MKDKLYMKNTLGVTSAAFGHCIFISLTSMALPMFFTDVLFISPAMVSIIFLVARIWDAINDPMMGSLVDRTRTRWGKCRPFLLFASVPLAILTVLMFTPVNFSEGGKVAYAFVSYLLFITAFTALDIPMAGLKPMLYDTPEKRNKGLSFSNTFGSLGSLLAVDLFFILVDLIGGGNDKKGFFLTVLGLSVLGLITLITGFLMTKEVVPVSENKIPFKKVVKTVFSNKYLLITIAVTLCSIGISAYGIMLPYFSKWNLADMFSFGALSVEAVLIPILSTATGIVYMVAVMITPYLLKLADKKKMFIIMSALGFVLNMLSFFCGYNNIIVFIVIRIFAHMPTAVTATITAYMIMDCLDYAEYKSGERTEGMTYACNNFVTKAGNAIFSAAVIFVMGVFGYNAAIFEPSLSVGESISYNYPEMLESVYFMLTVLPAIGCVIQIIPMIFYKLDDKKMKVIVEELKARRGENKEAEADLTQGCEAEETTVCESCGN